MPLELAVHHRTGRLSELLAQGLIDCVVADSEDGFSQLGQERDLLSVTLGYEDIELVEWVLDGCKVRLKPTIGDLAPWCRERSPEITLVVMPSRQVDPPPKLKGLILSPYDGSRCYLPFANGEWSRPHRDFMYSVAWMALHQATHRLGARHPALMHLSRTRTWKDEFKWEATFCQLEAALNFQDEFGLLAGVTFWDPFDGNPVADAVRYFEGGANRSRHRPFAYFSTEQWGIHFVTIDFRRR